MSNRALIRNLTLVGIGATLLVAFNNCGKGQTADSMGTDASSIGSTSIYNAVDVCKEEDITVFQRGYHQFLSQACKNCHINGPGKGTFASPDVTSAFSGFMMLGYDKISQYAVNNSHNPPYTGTQNLEIINNLRLQWQTYQKEKASCGTGNTTVAEPTTFTPEFETSMQNIPQINSSTSTVTVNGTSTQVTTFDRKVLSWDLSKTISSLNGKAIPNLVGAQLSVTVTGFKIPTGETAYLITLPMLKVGSNSLHIQGMNFRINGFPVNYATTFKRIDKNMFQNSTGLLAPGSLVSVGPLGASDTLSVQFGNIEIINMAAPPPPPEVNFNLANMTILPSQLGYANKVTVTVAINGENLESISVPINFVSTTDYPSGETPANSVLGSNGINRFDWDYKLADGSTTSLTFKPGQKTASFDLVFSDDERNDVDKVLRLSIGTPLGANIGQNSNLVISLPNYNPPYAGSAPTFALLMKSTSVLGKNCVKCHNSVQRQGGYDMTDYEDMKKRGIIIPGDLVGNDHKMFRRMNADAPNLEGLQSMPLDGFRPRAEVDMVNQWILDGARNN